MSKKKANNVEPNTREVISQESLEKFIAAFTKLVVQKDTSREYLSRLPSPYSTLRCLVELATVRVALRKARKDSVQ